MKKHTTTNAIEKIHLVQLMTLEGFFPSATENYSRMLLMGTHGSLYQLKYVWERERDNIVLCKPRSRERDWVS